MKNKLKGIGVVFAVTIILAVIFEMPTECNDNINTVVPAETPTVLMVAAAVVAAAVTAAPAESKH